MNPKIIFMGTPYFALESLKTIYNNNFEIIGVICQPDKISGRGKKLEMPVTKVFALDNSIPVFQPTNKTELFDTVKKLNPDLVIVAAYGKIISKETLEIPKYGTLNVHGSILPKFRGSSCIAQSILEGDEFSGITIMEVDEEMDAGNIISAVKVKIESDDTTGSLTNKLAVAGAKEIARIIPPWLKGEIKSCEQCHAEATYCRLIRKEDGNIDWSKPAVEIERMTRAFYPWPAAFTFLNSKLIKIIKARISDKVLTPGEIIVENKKLFVGTGTKALEIIKIQPEGKKEMSATDFLNGTRINEGTFLCSE